MPIAKLGNPFTGQAQALEELETWDTSITQLNLGLVDAALARDRLTQATAALDLQEAEITLSISGRNESERKANLVIAMAESTETQRLTAAVRDARLKLADADRRITIEKERCRCKRSRPPHGAVVSEQPDHNRGL